MTRVLFALVVLAVPALAQSPVPPPIAELRGALIFANGGNPSDAARDRFFTLAGKDKAKLVIVLAGDADPDLDPWKKLGPASVVSVRPDAPTAAKALADATGVWLAGTTDALGAELQRLFDRGGVIGGAAEFDRLPGFAAEPRAGVVGLRIGPGAAVVAKGRRLTVVGDGAATTVLAAGAGRPRLEQVLKKGETADLFQLRRAAANRAASDPFPPAKPKDPVVEKGTLVIVGGGGTTPEIMDRFFSAAGGKDSLVVVIPTANEQEVVPDDPGDAKYLRKWGGTNVKVLHTRDRKTADDPAFSKVLTEAKGVWFGGGRQWRFVDAYEGTLTETRFREVLARGGVIGGSSAGASIQSEYMPRGHPLGNMVMAAEGYERGFGYLPGAAVDQHFFARKRTADMTGLMKRYPQYLGIGIDESTAVVVTGHTAEVMGKSKAAFFDYRAGPPEGYRDYVEVKAGEKYDLKARKKVEE
jgi:cyanophycinase